METTSRKTSEIIGSAGMALGYCLYVCLICLLRAVYEAQGSVYQGVDFSPSLALSIFFVILPWVPFAAVLALWIRKNGWRATYAYSRDAVQKHWLKLLLYFVLLYVWRRSYTPGYFSVELPGLPYIALDNSLTSQVVMIFVYYLVEPMCSLAFFLLLPLWLILAHGLVYGNR